jgi:hypothetical protein
MLYAPSGSNRNTRREIDIERFTETSVNIYQNIRLHIPENFNLHGHRCEIIKSQLDIYS